jgi:hypothetical protein
LGEKEEKGKKKKNKRETARGLFSQSRTPCWLCCAGFSWLLSAIKG